MKQLYVKSTGERIAGTFEKVPGCAMASGFNADGTPIYEGTTDLYWDNQYTESDPISGSWIYICEGGDQWTLADLEFRDEEEE